MSWEIHKLEDVTTKIGDGLHGTPKYNENGDYFFINGNNFIQGRVQIKQDTKRIDYDEYLKIKKPLNQQTLFVAINGTLGNIALYNDENVALGKSACYLNIREDVSRDFVRYVLEDEKFQRYAQLFATGATIKNLGLKAIREYSFELPPLKTQKRIASILSAYDDLIENNLKRIKLLEETAQNIYKEWFVNFRFPNYEHSEFDKISGLPVGWEMKKMDELMQISGGGTPSTKEPNYWDGEILWFSPTDLGKNSSLILLNSSKKITSEGLSKSSAKLLPPMTILMSSRATIGLFGMINKECSTNQGFINIVPKEIIYRYYILQNLISRKSEILGKATGTTFKEISKGVFNSMTIVKPKSNVVKLYFDFADSLFKQVENIEIQNQKLKEARDILLPRLMNRTIEV